MSSVLSVLNSFWMVKPHFQWPGSGSPDISIPASSCSYGGIWRDLDGCHVSYKRQIITDMPWICLRTAPQSKPSGPCDSACGHSSAEELARCWQDLCEILNGQTLTFQQGCYRFSELLWRKELIIWYWYIYIYIILLTIPRRGSMHPILLI